MQLTPDQTHSIDSEDTGKNKCIKAELKPDQHNRCRIKGPEALLIKSGEQMH